MQHSDHARHARAVNGLLSRRGSTRTIDWSSAAARWIKVALSTSLMLVATVMGVQLGVGAPTTSPVAPVPPVTVSTAQPPAGAGTSRSVILGKSRKDPRGGDDGHF